MRRVIRVSLLGHNACEYLPVLHFAHRLLWALATHLNFRHFKWETNAYLK